MKKLILRSALISIAIMSASARAQQIDYTQPYLMADQPDAWQPYAGVSYAYDDNLLRVPAAQVAGPTSDTSWTREAGIGFDHVYSRQHIAANFDVTKTTFERFNAIDYIGKDAAFDWTYGITDYITGDVTSTYSQALTPFTQFHLEQLNLRTQKTDAINIYLHLTPSWQMYASVSDYELRYDLLSQQSANRDTHVYNLGFDYVSAAGNILGLVAGHEEGEFPIQELIGNEFYNNDYQQNSIGVRMDWTVSGLTHLQLSGGWEKRTYEEFPVRDASGPSARLVATYIATGKSSLLVTAYRDIDASDNLTTQYTINKGLSLSPIWDPVDKIRVQGMLKQESFNYTTGALFAALLPQNRIDTLKSASLSATYTPTRRVQASLSIYTDKLSSTLSEYNYRDKGLLLNARIAF